MITFEQLANANLHRQQEWPGNEKADVAFRALEVVGEAGEVAEAVKKFLRAERGIYGSVASVEDIASELADVVIAADLLATQLHVDLGHHVAMKFNATSMKYGLKTRITKDRGA